MKAAAAISPGVVKPVEIPMPKYGDYECLLKTTACGFCNSTDLKIIEGDLHNFDVKFPLIFGHEGVGRVVKTGSKVRYIKSGDVFANPTGVLMPGTQFHSMWTAMAEYSTVKDVRAMVEDGADPAKIHPPACRLVPPEIDPVEAVVLLTIKENYSALKNFKIEPGQDILVYGDGPVGFGLVKMLRIFKAGFVCCLGHHDDRLKTIHEDGGADLCINTAKEYAAETMGEQMFDLVIDAVGKSSIILEGASRLKPGGRMGAYGVLHRADADINLLDLPNHVVLHMLNFPFGEHDAHTKVLKLVEDKLIDLKQFYSHVMNVEKITDALELVKKRQTMKIIITFD